MDRLDERVATTIVTIVVYGTDDAWDMETVSEASPWEVEGLLREALRRRTLLNEIIRSQFEEPDESDDDN